MNVKKTALATAIALTMAGGSSPPLWAETTTVKGDFIADKTEVEGDNTVNFALLGLNKDGEVDRFGEKKGSTILAVVNTIKGTIQGGGDRPNEPGEGYFASEVRYVELNQGVGRVSIYYPNEIAGSADTTDTVTVNLLERLPDGTFADIGESVDKTITIKAGTSTPTMLTLTEFERAPVDPLNDVLGSEKTTATGMGLPAIMTAGYEGAQIRVVGNNRAVNNVTLKIIDTKSPDVPLYTNTRRMVLGEALFTLGSKITKAGTYPMVAELVSESDDAVPVSSVRMNGQDTLTVWSTRKPASLMLAVDKQRIANPGAEVFENGMCKQSFPANQVCQGTMIKLMLRDEYGNETSLTDRSDDLTVVVGDNNNFVKDVKFKIPAGSSMAEPIDGGDWKLGNQTGEIIKAGATSLVAKVVGGGGGIADSDPIAIKVIDKSLSASATPEFERSQKAGTEFKAFFVRVVNRAGTVLTDSPGNKVAIKSQSGEELVATRFSDTSIEGFFKKATHGPYEDKYLLSDQGGNLAQVWANGKRITPAAANDVRMRSTSGDEVTAISPIYDQEQREYIVLIPEIAISMEDTYGNPITENRGDFIVNKPGSAKAIRYVGANVPGGFSNGNELQVVYDPEAFSGEDTITIGFNKLALSDKTLQVTTVIPPPVREGLGSIKSYIETNDIPVNSEVALTVETLDKQGRLFSGETTVTVTFDEGEPGEEGEDVNILTPKVIELTRGSVDDSLAEAACDDIPRGEFVVGSGCNLSKIRLADCIENGYIYTEDDGCQKQEESIVASGGRLIFNGRKLFVVEAGPRVGQFGITFKDANRPDEIKDARTFKVTNEIVPPTPGNLKDCLGEGNLWMEDDETCKSLPDISTGGPFVIGPGGEPETSDARITGGASIDGGDFTGGDARLSDALEIQFVGNIKFDPAHDGKEVDIIALALYQPNPLFGGSRGAAYFSLTEKTPYTVYWADLTNPAEIVSFYDEPHTIVKDEPKVVEIYKGKFEAPAFVASTIEVWLGYRLDDGTIIFNPESIRVTLLP
jgi:hypothetical protein